MVEMINKFGIQLSPFFQNQNHGIVSNIFSNRFPTDFQATVNLTQLDKVSPLAHMARLWHFDLGIDSSNKGQTRQTSNLLSLAVRGFLTQGLQHKATILAHKLSSIAESSTVLGGFNMRDHKFQFRIHFVRSLWDLILPLLFLSFCK